MRTTLIATGLGGILGFQTWKIIECIIPSIPWYGHTWIWLSQSFLGLTIGLTASRRRWWERALVLGLAFAIPSASGAFALGQRRIPYGIAAITASLVVALLIAFLADAIFPPGRKKSDQHSFRLSRLPEADRNTVEEHRTVARQRLAEAKALLDQIDDERERQANSDYWKTTEARIIWGELLDLELQDLDEQLNRIRQTAGDAPSPPAG